MAEEERTLTEIISLSRELASEERQLVILGEGNTSADCGDGTFWVKASGSQLRDIDASGFCRVRMQPILDLMNAGQLPDAQIAAEMREALVEGVNRQPSVETFLHALCLNEGGARFVGHTHPISVNQFLCSRLGAQPLLRHLFPDAIVVCGIAPAVVDYVDPGVPLAQAVRDELRRYKQAHGRSPKILLMVNHGLVALGQTSREVLNISLMADKWARILHGTYALGGPRYMQDIDVQRIDGRLDEHYRRQQLSE